MDKEDRNKSLIKKADSLTKFDPNKKKELIVRGLKDTYLQKTVLFVYRAEHHYVHSLIDEEISDVFGNKINLVHFYLPIDAFDYLISNSVDLVISEILFEDRNGVQLLNACKTLYPHLPFIIYCAYDYIKEMFKNHTPDYYIQISSDFSELLEAIEKCLNSSENTAVVNSSIEAEDISTLIFLANAYFCLERNERTINILLRAVQMSPHDIFACLQLGLAYNLTGMHKKAIEAYKQVIRIEPNNVKAHYYLGGVYYDLGRYKEAIAAYKQALKIKPDDAHSQRDLGLTYLKIGQKTKALEEYQLLKNINPELANQLFNLIYK